MPTPIQAALMAHDNAFPVLIPQHDYFNQGMTKREYYAGLAMAAMLSNQELYKIVLKNLPGEHHASFYNTAAIEQADDLLKQLAKQ